MIFTKEYYYIGDKYRNFIQTFTLLSK